MLLSHNIYKNCLDSLKIPPEERSEDDIERMFPYINTLTSFINNLRQANLKSYHDTLREILQNMTLCTIPKDRFVVKYGEKGNVFYIILNGSVSIIIVKNKEGYLNEEEYINHLLQLRKNKESELLKMTIALNHNVFHIDESFDNWIKNQSIRKNSPYSKELISQMKTTLQYMQYNIDCFQDGVNNEKYLKFINPPDLYESSKNNRKNVIIPYYEFINEFYTGQTFGYFALENPDQKRKATLITLENSDFGIISREVYNKLLRSVHEIIRKKFYKTVYSLPLFQGIARVTFENYYYDFFEYKVMAKGIFLLEEGKISNHIYVVSSGEYEISIKGNVIDINNILIFLKTLAGMKKKKKRFSEEIENEELELDKRFKTNFFLEEVQKKNEIKLGIIKNNDVIGLNDLVNLKNRIAYFSVKCLTHDSGVYSIERRLYRRMYLGYEGEDFVKTKIPFLIDRLETFKKSIFEKVMFKEKEIRKYNRHLFIQIKKPLNDFKFYKSEENNEKINEMIKFSRHHRNKGDKDIFLTIPKLSTSNLNLKNKNNNDDNKESEITKTEGNNLIQELKLPIIKNDVFPKTTLKKILNRELYSGVFRNYINLDNEVENNKLIHSQSNVSDNKKIIKSIHFSTPRGEVGVFDPLIMYKFDFTYKKAIKNLLKEIKK